MSFADAVRSVLTQYANFTGRARRSEFWWYTLFTAVVYFVLGIVAAAAHTSVLTYIVALALFVPTLAVSVRRLHDTGRSGWWVLVDLVPFVGWIVLVVFCVQDSQPGTNAYGPSPKGADVIPGAIA
ncbi:MAG TPA: DUF805 domain-containing protein [Pedococcus sp.]|jgi:uncharacterized membrane protein YhaH (DUF805 family)|nr:DUF805 domain-containing protein [Pedococcus sp.]